MPQTYAWNFNVKEPPFNDKRVRQAINYAIDRDTYANVIMKGLAKPATSVFGPGMAGYDPSFEMYKYDPDKAKALLQEAGVGSGLSFKIQTAKAQGMDDVALFVKDNLAKIGVNVDVELFDFPTILANANKSGTLPGVAAIGWSWIADPAFNFDRFFTSAFGPPNGVNFGFYNNPAVDAGHRRRGQDRRPRSAAEEIPGPESDGDRGRRLVVPVSPGRGARRDQQAQLEQRELDDLSHFATLPFKA